MNTHCPFCGLSILINQSLSGKESSCPKCGSQFVMPSVDAPFIVSGTASNTNIRSVVKKINKKDSSSLSFIMTAMTVVVFTGCFALCCGGMFSGKPAGEQAAYVTNGPGVIANRITIGCAYKHDFDKMASLVTSGDTAALAGFCAEGIAGQTMRRFNPGESVFVDRISWGASFIRTQGDHRQYWVYSECVVNRPVINKAAKRAITD